MRKVVIAGCGSICRDQWIKPIKKFQDVQMAENMKDAWEMIEQAEGYKKAYAIIQNRRYTENIIQYRDVIRSGAVGRLTTLNADFYIGAHFDGFRNEMKHALLLDMAIHCFDQARFIGDLEPVSVYCHDWNPHGSWYKHGASAMAIFEMANDVIFSFRGSWCSEGIDTSWDCNWKAVGDKGTILWDGYNKIEGEAVAEDQGFIRSKKKIKIPATSELKYPGHSGVIREFLDSLESGKNPQTVCTDNIKSLAMVFAAIESTETGKKVNIKSKC